MKIKEIFTPGRFPTWTYVDEHLKIKEQQLFDALDDGSMLVSISGPSKSGKTVFVEHILGKENLIQPTFRRLTGYFQYVCQEAMAEIYIRQRFQGLSRFLVASHA